MYPYQFSARFLDGSTIEQGNDRSALRAGGSAFTDVRLAIERGKPVISFALLGEHTVEVDLSTGLFTIDGQALEPGAEVPAFCCWRTDTREMPDGIPGGPNGYQASLIYYRRNVVAMASGAIPEITHFCLGYEVGGSKVVLGVSP